MQSEKYEAWRHAQKNDPILQLTPMVDELEWLMAGEPDFEHSVTFLASCREEGDPAKVSDLLVEFYKKHTFTFWASGWVRAVVGRLVLGDKMAIGRFLMYRKYKNPR